MVPNERSEQDDSEFFDYYFLPSPSHQAASPEELMESFECS
jgi:hypothetical protein